MPHSVERSPHNLLIFGQGPVVDVASREKAEAAGTLPGNERLNFWSESLVDAAALIYRQGATSKLIVVGGKTGGLAYQSEAELIASGLHSRGIALSEIITENRSTNTLENLVNFCNSFLDRQGEIAGSIDILGAPYHLARMKLLMKLFAIPYASVFSADAIVKNAAEQGSPIDHTILKEVEQRADLNKETYYESKKGTEQKTFRRRMQEEDVWTRALLTIPEYSLRYFGRVRNDRRLANILQNVETLFPGTLAEKGIYRGQDLADVRQRLLLIDRKMPNVENWIAEHESHGMPEVVIQKMQLLR